ncbi:Bug family tripartite tricarboxylate transporter substrate binding protein [Ramlibacter sp.]|uniref:Bug family tripartite tricarboxylate transporter substrate binding protein n=1 Tax=Ramlibacter sp. TaxID=1917967 RepID=UPI003D14971A
MQRRHFNQMLSTFALGALPAAVRAQGAWPDKPVKIVIGFGPGSGTDIIARLMAEELRQALGQPFVVENRPGASAQIAAGAVAKSPNDGYTLMLTSNTTHSVNPHLFKKLPYDPMADFTPIGGVAYFPFILAVNASLPVRTAQELVTYAQQNKGKVAYAYGTPTVQIPAEAINRLKDMGAIGVPYKSSPPALTDVVGGQAQFLVVDLASAKPHLQSGRLRALAVTMARRSSLAPELPTVGEALGLRDFDLAAWTGMFGPANLPKDVVDKVSGALQRALARPEVRDRIIGMGAEPTPSDPATFSALVKRQLEVWGKNVQLAGIQPE